MGWSKIAVFTLLLVIIFTVGFFGSHFDYSVNGIPKNEAFSAIQPVNPGDRDTAYRVYFDDGTTAVVSADELKDLSKGANILDYLSALATASIDGMPVFITLVFWIIVLLALFILVTMFLPGGGG